MDRPNGDAGQAEARTATRKQVQKVMLTPEQIAWLRKKGGELDLSMSRLVREGINKLIEAYGE